MRKRLFLVTTIILVLFLAACGSGNNGESKKITVGAKGFTEQFILGKLTTILLEENGFDVDEKSNLGSTALRQALENKQVDIAWDYTGTGLVTYLGEDPVQDGDEAFKLLNEIDQEENEITWTNLSEADNTYAIIMRAAHAEELGITTLSDFAAYMNENPGELGMATNAEFANRPDGIPGVEETYGFEFSSDSIHEMDPGLTYSALKDEEVDASVGFATDSRIVEFDLVLLEDDKGFFPAYHAAIAMTTETYEKYPEIEEIFEPLQQLLDSDTMRELNYQVDIEDKNETDVARDFLIENGLIEE